MTTNNQTYFKYRSLESWDHVLDILMNERLYAAEFVKLNDPMEGLFRYDPNVADLNLLNRIVEVKKQLRICSLSETPDNHLMWSYYANGHRGICIEVELRKNIIARPIDYSGISTLQPSHDERYVYEILSRKEAFWAHEQEHRVISAAMRIPIKIRSVIFGKSITNAHKEILKKLVMLLNINFREA